MCKFSSPFDDAQHQKVCRQSPTMNPQGGAAYSSTWRIHCETIVKLLREELCVYFLFFDHYKAVNLWFC